MKYICFVIGLVGLPVVYYAAYGFAGGLGAGACVGVVWLAMTFRSGALDLWGARWQDDSGRNTVLALKEYARIQMVCSVVLAGAFLWSLTLDAVAISITIVVLWVLVTGQFVFCSRAIKRTEQETESVCSEGSDTPEDV